MPKRKPPASDRSARGRFITIDGRRWRSSDPAIPENFRKELVNELMAARRAVGQAGSERAVRQSRARVNDAKVALGERGRAWWLPPTALATARRIDATLMALLRSRLPGRTICPSDVARIVGGERWRTLMTAVRERAVRLRDERRLEILRGGQVLETGLTGGTLRYRLALRTRQLSSSAPLVSARAR